MKKTEINGNEVLDEKEKEKELLNIETISNATTISSYILLSIGFLIYLGQKKIEYKTKFNYTTFLLGKSECLDTSPKTDYISGILHSFD